MRHRPDVLIIGTDPIFSVLVALPWRLLRPKTKRFHWCFDLHPEAAIAEGMVGPEHFVVRTLRPFLRWAYQSCHLLGSLGPCMTERLHIYHPSCPIMTLTPWALFEPETPAPVDPEERQALFGDATLGLLYSGNFGKAHEAGCFLALARKLRAHRGIQFAFSIRGNRAAELVQMVTPEDTNIRFVDFAHQDRLDQRLGAADIHLVSLRSNYVGTVVPSKFQGAIATGRAILYAGPEDSAVATWVREFDLGWNLTPASVESVAQALIKLSQDPLAIAAQNQRCHRIYQQRFSRQAMLDLADCSLRAMRDVTCGLTEPRRV